MRKYSFVLIFLIIVCGCNSQNNSDKYQQQFSVVHKFLNKLSNDDTIGVKEMIGVNISTISKNNEILSFEVNQLSKLLNSKKLPDENTYRLIEYQPSDIRLLDMMIPIEKDTLEIRFAKFLPVDKIWGYYWHRQFSNNNLIALPPDSIKH